MSHMQKQFILFLVLAILIAIFALTNAEVMRVSLFFTSVELSGSLVILFSVALGALLVVVFGLFAWIKNKLLIKDLNQQVKTSQRHAEELLAEQKRLIAQVQDLQAELSVCQQEATASTTTKGINND